MTVTTTLETELSSHTKEDSKRWSSCGMKRGDASYCWETLSWELSPPLDPTLTFDWDDTHSSLQLYSARSLEWMSRRRKSWDDDHEEGSWRSSLGNHKTWRSWEKTPIQATKGEDVWPDLPRSVPTICVFLRILFQKRLNNFAINMLLQNTTITDQNVRVSILKSSDLSKPDNE